MYVCSLRKDSIRATHTDAIYTDVLTAWMSTFERFKRELETFISVKV